MVGSFAGRVSPEKRRSNLAETPPLPSSHPSIHPLATPVSLVVSGVSSLLFLSHLRHLGDKPGPFPKTRSLLLTVSLYADIFSASFPCRPFDFTLRCRHCHEGQRFPETMTPCARLLSMHEPQAPYSIYMRTFELIQLGSESTAFLNPTPQSTNDSRANTHPHACPPTAYTHTNKRSPRSPTPQPLTLDCALPPQISPSHHSQPNGALDDHPRSSFS